MKTEESINQLTCLCDRLKYELNKTVCEKKVELKKINNLNNSIYIAENILQEIDGPEYV